MTRRRYLLALAILLALLLLVAVLSLGMGSVALAPRAVLAALSRSGAEDATSRAIVWDLRVPRILLGILIGGGLAASGAAFQGLFRNPLADPFVVGASGGAALGATLAIVFGATWSLGGLSPVALMAFVGAVLAVALVYGVAQVGGTAPVIALVLAGSALSTLLSALVSMLMLFSEHSLMETYSWLLGGLSGRSWSHLATSWPYLVVGSAALWLLARPLDALACGDETAQSLGLTLSRTRGLIVLMATLTTAAAVSAVGIIGFVGLIAPHIARLLFGASHSRLIPASMLIGGLLLLAADDVARTVMAPVEIPVGIVMSVLGGPFFLYLIKSRQRALGGRE